jgi:hypothetical protein
VRAVPGSVAGHPGDADPPAPAPRTRTTGRAGYEAGAQVRPFGGRSRARVQEAVLVTRASGTPAARSRIQ